LINVITTNSRDHGWTSDVALSTILCIPNATLGLTDQSVGIISETMLPLPHFT